MGLIEEAEKLCESVEYNESGLLNPQRHLVETIRALLDQLEQKDKEIGQIENSNKEIYKDYCFVAKLNEELKARNEKLERVVVAVRSLNLDKVEGYMMLGKSYKDIIVEALNSIGEDK